MATKIIRCECRHEFQDDRYGKNMRVHNNCRPAEKNNKVWRCTVCLKEKGE